MAQKSIAQAENAELRAYAKGKNVFLWQIADALNIAEPTLLRWLRFPLSEEKKAAFIRAVDIIATGKGGTNA